MLSATALKTTNITYGNGHDNLLKTFSAIQKYLTNITKTQLFDKKEVNDTAVVLTEQK